MVSEIPRRPSEERYLNDLRRRATKPFPWGKWLIVTAVIILANAFYGGW